MAHLLRGTRSSLPWAETNNFNLTDINGVENPQVDGLLNLVYKVTDNK